MNPIAENFAKKHPDLAPNCTVGSPGEWINLVCTIIQRKQRSCYERVQELERNERLAREVETAWRLTERLEK